MSSIASHETHTTQESSTQQPNSTERLKHLEDPQVIPVSDWTVSNRFTIPRIRARLEMMRHPDCLPYGPYGQLEFSDRGRMSENQRRAIAEAVSDLAELINVDIIFRFGTASDPIKRYLDRATTKRALPGRVFDEMCGMIDIPHTCWLLQTKYEAKAAGSLELPGEVIYYLPAEQIPLLTAWDAGVIADVLISQANAALEKRWAAKVKAVEDHLGQMEAREAREAAEAHSRGRYVRWKNRVRCWPRFSKSSTLTRTLDGTLSDGSTLSKIRDVQTSVAATEGCDSQVSPADQGAASTAAPTVTIVGEVEHTTYEESCWSRD